MSALKKFYYCTATFLLVTVSWIIWNLFCLQESKPGIQICILKNTVGLACPSCGTTRSILHLLHGDLHNAFFLNPFGLVAFLGIVVLPIWIIYDFLQSKRTLWYTYLFFINLFQNKKFSFFVVVLVIINWIWNIQKGV